MSCDVFLCDVMQCGVMSPPPTPCHVTPCDVMGDVIGCGVMRRGCLMWRIAKALNYREFMSQQHPRDFYSNAR